MDSDMYINTAGAKGRAFNREEYMRNEQKCRKREQ